MSVPTTTLGGGAGVPENLADPVERLIAAFIDFGIIFAGLVVVLLIDLVLALVPVLGWLLGMMLTFFYVAGAHLFFFVYMPASSPARQGQTIGKKWRGIMVVKGDGSEYRMGDAFMRDVVGRILCTLTLGIGLLMILFDANKQGLHDKIAKTYVVKATPGVLSAGPKTTGPITTIITTSCPQCGKQYAGDLQGQFCEQCGTKM